MNSRKAQRIRKRAFFFLGAIALLIVVAVVVRVVQFVPQAVDYLTNKKIELKKTPENKINMLLLGTGGAKHDGPNLSDTIIFASIDPEHDKVTLVSIPRDLWIPDLNAKINTAYAYGEDKGPGGGLVLAKKELSRVLGQQIDYAVRVDFGGFVKAVDMLGGLDINVDRTFDDYAYPIEGKEDASCGLTETQIASASAEIATASATELQKFPCRFEHLHFNAGEQHMDGATALEYVRSRHAVGPEGTDFARSKRQEKVISAFKQKVFSAGTYLNPVKIISLLAIFKGSVATDISENDIGNFAKLAQRMKSAKITSYVIDMGNGDRQGLLVNPTDVANFGGQWVLSPRAGAGDYSEIHQYVSCVIKNDNCVVTRTGVVTPTPTPTAGVPPKTR